MLMCSVNAGVVLFARGASADCNFGCSEKSTYAQVTQLAALVDPKIDVVPCRATVVHIEEADWSRVVERLWATTQFRSHSPDGYCFERSTAISKELDDLGFKSEKLLLRGNILAPFKNDKGYEAVFYDVHVTNVVQRKTKEGRIEKWVIDPAFIDKPVPLEEYRQRMAVPFSSPATALSLYPQNFEPSRDSPDTTLSGTSECKYSREQLAFADEKLNEAKEPSSSRTSFDTPEQAKNAYQYFYQIPVSQMKPRSRESIEDVRKTLNNLPPHSREARWKSIEAYSLRGR